MFRLPLLALALCLAASGTARAAEAPPVVASILPVQALAAGVMEGVGAPYLLMKGGASPHAYALRPSDARRLAEARVVLWMGEALETFLARPLDALAGKARVVTLLEAPGLTLLPLREGGPWEEHEEEHAGEKEEIHRLDAHAWLDPANAAVLTRAIAAALAEADPANAARYRANAQALEARLEALDAKLEARLAPVARRPYIVFHDAYQYFERRYSLSPVGSVTLNPALGPSARRILDLRERLRRSGAACVFIEPQFEPRLARTVIEGTGARLAVLDPLGATLAPGSEAYFTLMETLADSLAGCLSGG